MVFLGCSDLKIVSFQKDSRLERIGRKCFCASGLEEIQIPETVSTIGAGAFKNCTSLTAICMTDNCKCCLSHADVPVSVHVCPQQEMV